jgi:hypothetical protein
MDSSGKDEPDGAPASAFWAYAGAPSGGAGPERCFSAQRKLTAITRLLRDPCSRSLDEVPAPRTVTRLSKLGLTRGSPPTA